MIVSKGMVLSICAGFRSVKFIPFRDCQFSIDLQHTHKAIIGKACGAKGESETTEAMPLLAFLIFILFISPLNFSY